MRKTEIKTNKGNVGDTEKEKKNIKSHTKTIKSQRKRNKRVVCVWMLVSPCVSTRDFYTFNL